MGLSGRVSPALDTSTRAGQGHGEAEGHSGELPRHTHSSGLALRKAVALSDQGSESSLHLSSAQSAWMSEETSWRGRIAPDLGGACQGYSLVLQWLLSSWESPVRFADLWKPLETEALSSSARGSSLSSPLW